MKTSRKINIKVAFGSVPKDGGTFTCYRNLRPQLLERGIDMRCVSVGRDQAQLWEGVYVDDGCVQLAPHAINAKKQSMLFSQWCEDEDIDIVLGINSAAILSAIPHLPERIRIVSRCANAFDHGYKIAMSGRERFAAIIATTPRLKEDLVKQYSADPALITQIPNGVDQSNFGSASVSTMASGDVLQIGFLGRLEHKQKGVLHIPAIVSELEKRSVNFKLRIAGKGKHRKDLERMLVSAIGSGKVEFVGALSPDEVPGFLRATHVFLFPSHFEGCPNALLEAVMAGCIPACWVIEGITDYIVRDGETGFLFQPGDCGSMADALALLAGDLSMRQAMSQEAAQDARDRFCIKGVAHDYAKLFNSVMDSAPPLWMPRPWSSFEADPNFDWSWKRYVPPRLKRIGRWVRG